MSPTPAPQSPGNGKSTIADAKSGILSAATLRKPATRYALLAGVVAALIWACFAVSANRPISVEVVSPAENVPVRVFGLGTVEARVLSKIGFEVGAALVELNADHGDRVTKGQVLARLNSGEQEAKVAKARAALLIAEVNIAKSAANIEKTRAVLAQKQEANRRKQTLVGRDIVSQQSAEEAVRDEAVAKADVAVAMSEAESAKAQVADARAQLQFEETMLRHRTLGSALRCPRHRAPQGARHRHQGRRSDLHAGRRRRLLGPGLRRRGPRRLHRGGAGRRGAPALSPAGSLHRARRPHWPRKRPCHRGAARLSQRREPAGPRLPRRAGGVLDHGRQAGQGAARARGRRAGLRWPHRAVSGRWKSGRLQQRLVKFRHRTEDSRLEIVDGLPEGARVVARRDDGLREGRSARIVEVKAK